MHILIKLEADDIASMSFGNNVGISPGFELEGLHFTIIFSREAALEFCDDVPVILAAIDRHKQKTQEETS